MTGAIPVPRHPAVCAAGAALLLGLGGASSAVAQGSLLPDTLDLEHAVDIALERSPDLAGLRAQADAAGAGQRAAWGAFLPQASVSLGLNRNSFTKTTFLSEEGTSETLPQPLESSSQSASQSFGLTWDLLRGGQRFAGLREGSASLRAANRRLDDRRLTVVAAARRAYYDALRRQRQLELAERQVEDRELELEITRRRYEIAAVERSDVLAAEQNLIDTQIQVLTERRLSEDALRGLAVTLGLPAEAGPGTVLSDVAIGASGRIPEARGVVEAVLAADPELRALEADRTAASAALWAARTNYLPTIRASLSWSRSQQFGPEASFFQLDPSDTGRFLSISASWNLFDGFQREQQTATASSQKRQAEESLRLRRLEIERDVRNYAAEIEQLSEAIALQERAFEISRERLAMERERYRLGTIDFTALQQAISAASSAERALTDRRFDLLLAWANLDEFAGVPR